MNAQNSLKPGLYFQFLRGALKNKGGKQRLRVIAQALRDLPTVLRTINPLTKQLEYVQWRRSVRAGDDPSQVARQIIGHLGLHLAETQGVFLATVFVGDTDAGKAYEIHTAQLAAGDADALAEFTRAVTEGLIAATPSPADLLIVTALPLPQPIIAP